MSPSAMPAISDADLARLLGFSSATPAMPNGFADRIVAPLPVSAPPFPTSPATRRRPEQRPAGRWLRGGVAIVAGLGLATAVAAGLSRTPTFAPVLAPVMTRLAEATGLPLLAPPKPALTAAPIAPARAVPSLREPPLPPPAVVIPDAVAAALPANVLPTPVRVPSPVERALARPRAGGLPAGLATPTLRDRASPARAPFERAMAPAAGERMAVERAAPVRAEVKRAGVERAGVERAGVPRVLPDRPALADRPMPEGAPVATAQPDAPPPAALSEPPAALPSGAATATETPAVRPATAAEAAAEVEKLREARKAGTLTDEKAERQRSLQQLRQLRTGRAPREALSRRRR